MSDFPWKWWVHRGESDCNGTLKMYLTGNSSNSSLVYAEKYISYILVIPSFPISCFASSISRALSKGKQERWLPAAEVNGEGIFIEFNKDTLASWLNSTAVKGLSEKYSDSHREFCESKGWTITVVRNAAYVLMHTFAHLMIKQMSMSSGYSSSAIRERIYFGDKMAGILLYTGSSDKEGSLGGLVELGNIDQMTNLMRDAFQEALVCTNDPECMSNLPAGKNSNGAACHSCCMISETACENGNRMLDRGLVVPIPGREDCSYFKELVSDLCQVEI